MKALSIQQPWAWMIVAGFKDVENRTWRTKYRGRILIHASSRPFPAREVRRWLDDEGLSRVKIPDRLPLGAICGAVTITDCVEEHDSVWFDGPFGFVLKDPRQLAAPIPCNGSLNVWNVPTRLEPRVRSARLLPAPAPGLFWPMNPKV